MSEWDHFIHKGKLVEELFAQRHLSDIKWANNYQNMHEHLDMEGGLNGKTLKFDVKGMNCLIVACRARWVRFGSRERLDASVVQEYTIFHERSLRENVCEMFATFLTFLPICFSVFGLARTSSYVFECIRMCSDASGCIWMHPTLLDISGNSVENQYFAFLARFLRSYTKMGVTSSFLDIF